MHRLLFSLLLLLSLSSCSSYFVGTKQEYKASEVVVKNPYFANLKQEYLFRGTVKFYKKELTGMFVVKRIDANEHRMVFTTDLGNTFFDFSISKNGYKVNYILDDINKKIIIKTLINDFRYLVQVQYPSDFENKQQNGTTYISLQNGKRVFLQENEDNQLLQIQIATKQKAKVSILFSPESPDELQAFQIVHHDIKLSMDFNKIPFE